MPSSFLYNLELLGPSERQTPWAIFISFGLPWPPTFPERSPSKFRQFAIGPAVVTATLRGATLSRHAGAGGAVIESSDECSDCGLTGPPSAGGSDCLEFDAMSGCTSHAAECPSVDGGQIARPAVRAMERRQVSDLVEGQ
jgi:hypothetical protein